MSDDPDDTVTESDVTDTYDDFPIQVDDTVTSSDGTDTYSDITDTSPIKASKFTASDFSATLAAELAAGIYEPSEVFDTFGLTTDEARAMLATPAFQAMVKQASAEWKALDNTEKRVRYKALVSVEELMPTLFGVVSDMKNPASSRTDAFKTFMKLAALDRAEVEGQSGQRFSISINLGADHAPIALQGTSIAGNRDEE